MDKLYKGILDYLKLEDGNMAAYAFAQSGFLLSINLFSHQQPIVNQEVFEIGNSIPENNLSYIPNGDFITSYSLFLNHLVPSHLPPDEKENYKRAALAKIEAEKAFAERENTTPIRMRSQKFKGNPESGKDLNQNFLQKIKQAENVVHKLLKKHQPIQRRSTTFNKAKLSQVPTLSQAMAEVSFITGARKIDGLNLYNMEVNSDPPKKIGSYAPRFEADVPKDLYQKWAYNEKNNIFPYEILASSQDPLYINDNSSPSFRKGAKSHHFSMGTYQIQAKFSGLEKVDLHPVNWFYPEFFIQNGYHLMETSPDYFGNNGILENIPSSIVLAFNVKMEIGFTKDGFDAFDNALARTKNKEGQKLSLGPIDIVPQGKQQNFNISQIHEANAIVLDTQQIKSANLVGVYSRKVSNYIADPSIGWKHI